MSNKLQKLPWGIALVLFLLAAPSAYAAGVTLAWDPSSSPEVAGYKVYYKIGSPVPPFDGVDALEGPSPIDVGNTLSRPLSGLQDNTTYYFTVTAYDSLGSESSFSNVAPWSTGSSNLFIPALHYPENGAANLPTAVQFDWSDPADSRAASYSLVYGTDPSLQAAVPPPLTFPSGPWPQIPPAGFALAMTMALLGVSLARSNRLRKGLIPLMLGAGLLVASCGGGDGEDPADNPDSVPAYAASIDNLTESTFEIYDFQPGTTYYWKVVADDGVTVTESTVYRFTIAAQ
jgi:hypothetical protein